MVAHKRHHLKDVDFVVGFYPERQPLGVDVAHGVFLIAFHVGVDTVEHGIDAGVAETGTVECERVIDVGKGEVLVLAREPAVLAGEGGDIGRIDALHIGIEEF